MIGSRNIPEYFVVGHDTPESLFDKHLLATEREKISLFFAGVGDARNLHSKSKAAAYSGSVSYKDLCWLVRSRTVTTYGCD